MPSDWREKASNETALLNAKWWESFEDPVLNNLIDTALANNRDLQVAIWRVSEYFSAYQMARSKLLPEIDAQGFALKERFSPQTNFVAPSFSPTIPQYDLNLSLSYEVDLWGKIRNTTKERYSLYLAQVENRRTVVLTLVGSVAQSYIYLRQLDLELEIAIATCKTRQDSLDLARERFIGGITSDIQVQQAISVLQESIADMKKFERMVREQENLLSILIGENPGPITRGKPVNQISIPPEIDTGIPSGLLTQRPDIMAAENNLIAANANIGVARAAFLPTVDLKGLYGSESTTLRDFFSKQNRIWLMGGSFLEKVFTGGRLRAQLSLREAQKKEMLFTYEQTILNALREVNDALIGFQKAQEIVGVLKIDVTALKEYLKLSWLRYYEGSTDYLTVLDAQRHLFSGELQLAEAEGAQFLFLVNLYKAVGGGWVLEADATTVKEKLKLN